MNIQWVEAARQRRRDRNYPGLWWPADSDMAERYGPGIRKASTGIAGQSNGAGGRVATVDRSMMVAAIYQVISRTMCRAGLGH